jgi:hypothetical protein
MPFYPVSLVDWVDIVAKAIAVLFAVIGGGWGLYQYFKSTRVKAAEMLLKVEEEFRNIFPTYAAIDDVPSYRNVIRPVLQAESAGTLDAAGLKKLTELDRCLRFLYLCSLLNEALGVDHALGVKGGALRRAYYHYLGILLHDESGETRPELLAYTGRYYPRLTNWVQKHSGELVEARKKTSLPTPGNESPTPQTSGGSTVK